MKVDDITLKLNKNLSKFLNFFTIELQKKVLELDTNIESKQYFEILKRLSNSLEQYVKKERSLFYIGFLGSYSSGKSSTINSLLNLASTNKARKVGTNPTDTHITLITNQTNTSSVFTFLKEDIIPIRTETNFDSDFLNNIVLMDTPGSGDPNIIETIVRDSLPLCDLIIYVLNATAPFTDIDKPFLIAQQSKLSEIPLLFILTRADEYKKNKTIETTGENFDDERFIEDLDVLVDRINEALRISSFSKDDFTIIDNVDKFNIKSLIDKIEAHTNGTNENLIQLHNHKLSYFEKEIKTIHNYFLGLTKSKIEKCEKFLSVAKNNIENFDEKIEVSKMKFKKLWNDNSESFNRIYDGTVKSHLNSLKDELDRILPLENYGDLIVYRIKKQNEIRGLAQSKSQQIISEMERFAYSEVTKMQNSIVDLLDDETLTLSDSIDFDNYFSSTYSFPLDKNEYINEFNTICKDLIQREKDVLESVIQKTSRSLKRKTPLDTINDDFIKYNEDFFEIMSLYYEAIKIYNLAAFSFEVRSYISELGLAKEFDKLESVEIDKAKYEAIAREKLMIDFKSSSLEFEAKLNSIFDTSLKVSSSIDKSEYNFDFSEELDNDLLKKKKDETYSNQIVSSFISETYKFLSDNFRSSISQLKKDIRRLKRKRIIRYIISIILLPVIFFLIKWILNYNDIKMPVGMNATILINIGSSILAAFIYSLFDRYKYVRIKTIKEFKREIVADNEIKAKELLTEFKEKIENKESEITGKLVELWKEEERNLFTKLLETPFSKLNSQSIELKKEVVSLIENYSNTYTVFHQNILSMFENQDASLKKINEIAAQIKEDSIKPSFDLLKNTINEIKTVKGEIEILN